MVKESEIYYSLTPQDGIKVLSSLVENRASIYRWAWFISLLPEYTTALQAWIIFQHDGILRSIHDDPWVNRHTTVSKLQSFLSLCCLFSLPCVHLLLQWAVSPLRFASSLANPATPYLLTAKGKRGKENSFLGRCYQQTLHAHWPKKHLRLDELGIE